MVKCGCLALKGQFNLIQKKKMRSTFFLLFESRIHTPVRSCIPIQKRGFSFAFFMWPMPCCTTWPTALIMHPFSKKMTNSVRACEVSHTLPITSAPISKKKPRHPSLFPKAFEVVPSVCIGLFLFPELSVRGGGSHDPASWVVLCLCTLCAAYCFASATLHFRCNLPFLRFSFF